MWSYYGAKTNIVHLYPPPKYGKIIEPFAGTARYSLKYFDREILLVDKYRVITDIWQWLQLCSPNDILKLPRLTQGQSLNNFNFDCPQAKMLMGFLISKGVESPRTTITNWVARDRPNFTNYLLKKISSNLFKIKHWKIINGTYENISNETATWFIDPPYQKGGHSYRESNKKIDFKFLGNWSRERLGQIIVCETMTADWMDFKPFNLQKGRVGMIKEAIWTNLKTSYSVEQKRLFK